MVDITEISAAVAAAGVLFGVVYYVLDLRHQGRIRQMDLLMRLHLHSANKESMDAYQKIRNIEFRDYDDFVAKYGPLTAEGPEQTAIMSIAMFMEGIGVLLHCKLAEANAIGELFPVEATWKNLNLY